MGADNSGVIYALWSYPAQAADELSFREGDMVTILQRPDGVDWWWASLCSREGFVPNNYFGSLPVPVYGNVSTLTNRSAAAAQREPIEEQDDLHYATIYTSCSENQVQSDQKEQSLPVPVYGNVSTLTNRSAAAAQREPIEEQDDLHYATIYTSCSENQVQSDQKEQVLYSLVNIKRPNAVPE
ncbi:hypothetical protein NHX12_008537 [Muraenolepis orangiensis]|uniref:SH3 domain-containing protein n=2 Tax=Muraenolepis orangiensis TaxID=630683 RepID=A0A9Q0DLP9_9TELE|nr:hypothetical protein NHX12_008537 [Muraenolepis orangiensis]